MKKENVKKLLAKPWMCILHNFIFGAIFFIVYVTSIILINGFTYASTESEIKLGYRIASIYALLLFGGNILIYFKKYKLDISVFKYIVIAVLSFFFGIISSFLYTTIFG